MTREDRLRARMLFEVTEVLFTALDPHAERVASEAIRDLVEDPNRDLHVCFLGAILIAHRGGSDRVPTERAFELAGACVVAVHHAIFSLREEERRERLTAAPRHPGSYA